MSASALPLSPTAAAINSEHRLARSAAESAVAHAIRCGELLLAKKAELKHGEFMSWVEANCEFAWSTGKRYALAARQKATGVAISNLSGLFPSGRPTEPQHSREPQAPPVDGMTVDDLAALPPLQQNGSADPICQPVGADIPEKFRNFAAKQSAIDSEIERLWGSVRAEMMFMTGGLQGSERRAAMRLIYEALVEGRALENGEPRIPIESGCITIGEVNDNVVVVLVESRNDPGFWHDIDVRHGSVSRRPCRILGLIYRLVSDVSLRAATWRTAADNGSWLPYCVEEA